MMKFRNSDSLSDAQLLERMAADDAGAFEALYRRHAPHVLGFARGMLKDPSRAEDIVQDVFMKLYLSRKTFSLREASLSTWLFTCTRNAVLNVLRSKWSSVLDLDSCGERPERESSDTASDIVAAVSSLSPRRSEIVRLKYAEGLSAKEIADQLGLSVRTVEKHLELARTDLRRTISS